MRKASSTIVMLVAAALTGAAALFVASGLPLPWNGPLTRRAYVDLLHGRLPVLECGRRKALSTDPGMTCSGLARDSVRGTLLFLRKGRVQVARRVWWRPAGSGRAFADSLVLAIATSRNRLPSARHRVPDVLAYDTLHVAWQAGESDACTAVVRAVSGVPHSATGPEGWVISLAEFDDGAPCTLP